MLSQIRNALRRGDNIRLTLKVGRLISKNGELFWKSNSDEVARTDDATSKFSKVTVGSC